MDQGNHGESKPAEQPLPRLSREALDRIGRAEKDARERYDRDKAPYFPLHPDFWFNEDFILRSMGRILEYIRLFAEEVAEAYLNEYLEAAPQDILTSNPLWWSIQENVWRQTDELWHGYYAVLRFEPSSRRARQTLAVRPGKIEDHPELNRVYPDASQWTELIIRLTGSGIAELNQRYENSIKATIQSLVRRYQDQASARLGWTRMEPQSHPSSVDLNAAEGHPDQNRDHARDRQPDAAPKLQYPNRAAWLRERLRERAWSHNDLLRFGGPDRKTALKILNGQLVREDVLERVVEALSKKHGTVLITDVPTD